MGLLDVFDTEGGQQALGLLAAASARSDGAGFGQRLSEAVGHTQAWKKQQAAQEEARQMQEYRKFQMQQQMEQIAQAKAQQEKQAKYDQIIGNNFQNAVGPAADGMGPTRPMAFDAQNAASQLGQSGQGMAALELLNKFKPPEPKFQVVGNSLVETNNPNGVKPVYTAPDKPEALPSAVREYEYARNQGYKGTFQNFLLEGKNASSPKVSVDLKDPTAVAKAAMGFQNDYRTATKDSFQRAQAFESMSQASSDPSAKGDLTMVYSFVKALDPTSVVREGEIGLVNANRSIPDKVKGYAQRLATGQSLLPEERQDLLTQAKTLMQTDYRRSRNDVKAYRDNAKRLGLDPELYAPDPYNNFEDMTRPKIRRFNIDGTEIKD